MTEHQHQRLAEVVARSLAELRPHVVPRADLFPKQQPEEAERAALVREKPRAAGNLSQNAIAVFHRIARWFEETIEERAAALFLDRNQEGRARTELFALGFIARAASLSRSDFFGLTDKGRQRAVEIGIPRQEFQSGVRHEVIRRRRNRQVMEQLPGVQILTSGQISGVRYDSLDLHPDGTRVAVQICDENAPAYEAERIRRLAESRDIDRVVLLVVDKQKGVRIAELLRQAWLGAVQGSAQKREHEDAASPPEETQDHARVQSGHSSRSRQDAQRAAEQRAAEQRAAEQRAEQAASKVLILPAALVVQPDVRWAEILRSGRGTERARTSTSTAREEGSR